MQPCYRIRCLVSTLIIGSALISAHNVGAQTSDPKKSSDSVDLPGSPALSMHKSASKTANVKSGIISALVAGEDTVTLRESAGRSAIYVFAAKTHYNKNRRAAQRSDFKAGDAVVLHFRRARSDGSLIISELDDPASWTWLTAMRKTTTAAVVTAITDDTLSVTVGGDSVPIDYTISEKTRWEKAGKEVEATAFKSGDHIFVVPRSLPSGSIMARAVADSSIGAAQEKERLAASVHGTITTVEPAAHRITIRTVAGDTRAFAYSDETEMIIGGKPQSLSTLKSGQHVSARIRREPGGDETVWRITTETPRKTLLSKKHSTVGKGVVTGP